MSGIRNSSFFWEDALINATKYLEPGRLKPYYYRLILTNDGDISLGQVVVAAARTQRKALLSNGEG